METVSLVKDILYQELSSVTEEKIQSHISNKKSPKIISEIISRCYPKILQLKGEIHENMVIFGESFLHFLLTLSLIPSQRKIVFRETKIDIIIPDLKSLTINPKDSLIIYFIKSTDKKLAKQRLGELEKIQPIKENIWIIANSKLETSYRVYYIKKSNSFSKILDDISEFLSLRKQNKLKILKS